MPTLRFTQSKDGTDRLTVRVNHRIDRGSLIEALAVYLVDTPWLAEEMGRREVIGVLRGTLEQNGSGEHWTEYAAEYEPYRIAHEAAVDRVRELFFPEEA